MEESHEDRIENRKKKNILKAVFITALIFISFILGNLAIRLGIVIGPDSDKYGYAINTAKKYPEFTTNTEANNRKNQLSFFCVKQASPINTSNDSIVVKP